MAETINITIPDIGDFSDVEIIDVLVAAGDSVSKEDGLITLETDKAAMDVPAPADGTIDSLTVKVGDTVSEGDVIGTLAVQDAATDPSPDGDSDSDSGESDSGDKDSGDGASEAAPEASEPTVTIAGASSEHTVAVPDIGDFTDVDVIEVHVAVGDSVAIDDPLVTLETDKAAMDVPSTVAGEVSEVRVAAGDKVSEGSAIAVIAGMAQESAAPAPAAQPAAPAAASKQEATAPAAQAATDAPKTAAGTLPPIDEAGFSKAHASPSVRRLARELGVNLAEVRGSGAKERILHDDVKAFVKAVLEGRRATVPAGPALPEVPTIDFSKFGSVDTEPLTRIQKISGPRLQASWINLPHVTQHDLADITELEERRQALKGPAKEKGISLTPLAFVMKACVAALKEFPKVNSSLAPDGKSLVMKNYCHLGFAADTENGLVVPVIRDADRMDVYELAKALAELSSAARDGKLKADQMQGASFTISSLGGIGGTAFTPIVNAPEVAILGVSRSSMQPVWNGSEFEPRLMLPLSLSYDHRVIDGAAAVRFTTFLGQKLADVEGLLQAIP